jgi:hypothetical protein
VFPSNRSTSRGSIPAMRAASAVDIAQP